MASERQVGSAASSLPATIGRYRILERIGKGAMGVVYGARDDVMDRQVAIKIMMADLEGEPETRARFYREAQAAGRLLHRNIITIFDMGDEDGRPFIVMERLQGQTLKEFLKQPEPVDLENKLDLMMQVCEGLAIAHSHNIFHRDIKPGNLFIQQDGTVKILDFGVARLANSNMTASGFILGTPDYMSPEQARGKEVDQRSDIFSAGAVFYLMLAGVKPFAAADLPAVLQRVEKDDPAALTAGQAPQDLAAAVMKALAKKPEERYQKTSDMLAALVRCKRHYEGETRKLAEGVRERYAALEAMIAERATLRQSVHAGREADDTDRLSAVLEARFPLLAERGAGSLASVPLRRADVVALSGEIDARRTDVEREVGELRAAEAAARAAAEREAREAQERAERLRQEEGRAAEVELQIGRAIEADARGDWKGAVKAADNVLALAPAHDKAAAIRRTAGAKLAEIAAAEARKAEAAAKLHAARGLVERGHYLEAIRLADLAAALDPHVRPSTEPLVQEAKWLESCAASVRSRDRAGRRRAEAAAPACLAGRNALASDQPARAFWAAESALAIDPDSREARGVLERAVTRLRAAGGGDLDGEATLDARALVTPQDGSDETVVLTPRQLRLARVAAIVGRWMGTAQSRMRSVRGQTTTEWLMVAGVLTAFALFLVKIVPGALATFVTGLAGGIRTIAP